MKLLVIIFTSFLLFSCMSTEERADWDREKALDKENEIRLLSYIKTYELCLIWDRYYKNTIYAENKRIDISKALQMSGRNPLVCRNPNQDSARRAEDKAEEAMRRAEEAEWRARNAERRNGVIQVPKIYFDKLLNSFF